MSYLDVFKMPVPVTIMGRTSSITNSFVNGIIPCIMPTEEQVRRNLQILDMDEKTVRCAYCGDHYTEWDHFRPLVENKRPTGYISEIDNLVPSCGKCNQSKGNKTWREWMDGDAPLSPKTRGVTGLEQKMERLRRYEEETHPVRLDFEKVIGSEKWAEHWQNCERLHIEMRKSQELSNDIRKILKESLVHVRNPRESGGNSPADGQPVKCGEIRIDPYAAQDVLESSRSLRPVGMLVQTEFKNLLESGKLDEKEIWNLQDISYSNRIFGINFPVLKRANSMARLSKERKDHLGRDRYYAKPVKIWGEWYLLSTQWYARNKGRLEAYLEKYGGIT